MSENAPRVSKEEVEKLLYTYQMLEEQLGNLNQQSSFISGQIQTLSISKKTLEGLQNVKEGHEMIIPVGSIFMKAKVSQENKVLVNLGAGIVAEKSIQEAIPYIDTMIQNVSGVQEKIQEEINQSEMRMNQIRPTVEAVYRSMGTQMKQPGAEKK
jgi:prefoldin alpha subunit